MTRSDDGEPGLAPVQRPADSGEVEGREALVLVPGEDPREAGGERRDVLVAEVGQARGAGHDGDRLAGAGRRERHEPVDAGRAPHVALARRLLLVDERPPVALAVLLDARRPSGPSRA